MLELKGLSYQVEDNGVKTEILRGIDLTIEDNKFVVITGPNGGGKTTLAKTIMGLAKSTAFFHSSSYLRSQWKHLCRCFFIQLAYISKVLFRQDQ